MSELLKLEQSIIEGKYSRKNIRQKVMDDIKTATEGEMNHVFVSAIQLLDKYLMSDGGYASKNARIHHVCDLIYGDNPVLTKEDLITEIFLIVIQVEGIQTIQTVCGQLAPLLRFSDVFDAIKTAAEILAVVCDCDLYNIIAPADSETGTLTVSCNYSLDEETKQYMASTKYLPPMICKPSYITSNRDNAYLTVTESMILGHSNHHDEYINLDNLNLANSFALSLDENILQYEEESSKPLDTEEKRKNFERLRAGSREVYDELLDQGNKFHNTLRYCKRGREYTQGYHVHIQATSHKKALINLYKKEVITC